MTKGDRDAIIVVMEIVWDEEKNELLKQTRSVSFEMVLEKIYSGDFIGPQINPTRSNQQRIIVLFNNYQYVVPFVKDGNGNWFLKTIFPSRKEKELLDEKNK